MHMSVDYKMTKEITATEYEAGSRVFSHTTGSQIRFTGWMATVNDIAKCGKHEGFAYKIYPFLCDYVCLPTYSYFVTIPYMIIS